MSVAHFERELKRLCFTTIWVIYGKVKQKLSVTIRNDSLAAFDVCEFNPFGHELITVGTSRFKFYCSHTICSKMLLCVCVFFKALEKNIHIFSKRFKDVYLSRQYAFCIC